MVLWHTSLSERKRIMLTCLFGSVEGTTASTMDEDIKQTAENRDVLHEVDLLWKACSFCVPEVMKNECCKNKFKVTAAISLLRKACFVSV